MIISQTPLRVSFVGGGTDLPDYYHEQSGAVLSTAIDKYIYVIVKGRFDEKVVVNYSQKEIVNNVVDVKHELIREALKMTGISNGIEITTLADIPSEGTGLGSSSSVTVGLLNAMYAYKGRQLSAERLANEACKIEIELCGKPIGKQDQYIAAFGGLNEIRFHPDETVEVINLDLTKQERLILGSNLLLFYTGITRKSSSILCKQKKEINNKRSLFTQMKDQVKYLHKYLLESEYDELGRLLDEGWNYKKQLVDNMTNKGIDTMYQKAKNAGALGGKISGAGGGGFLLLYVPRNKQDVVRKVLGEHRELPFMLTPFGSRVIFNIEKGN
ncbi:MAG: GHMP kinase [Bacteroidetes bacterium]|nr:GHMP kinase [Bacteroidota bacterium]